MTLIWMTLFGLRAIERPFEVGELLLKPDDAILFAHIPLFGGNQKRLQSSDICRNISAAATKNRAHVPA